jgi:hypothetical protein
MVVMTTRGRGVVLVVALALAAGLLALALGAKPTQAQAETYKFNDRETISGRMYNPCIEEEVPSGEEVTYEGTMHTVGHTTEDASGGFHIQGHVDLQVQGVSTSGAKYVVHEGTNDHLNFDVFSESASNFTYTLTLHWIRKGSEMSEDDLQAKGLVHATVNANGEVTSVFDEEWEAECK